MQLANVGSLDRILRIVIGAALILFTYFGNLAIPSSTLGIASIIVGAILIGTALFSFCPLYRIIGASTRSNV